MAAAEVTRGGLYHHFAGKQALFRAVVEAALRTLPLDATAQLLDAAYDRAALAIEGGANPTEWRVVLKALIDGLAVQPFRPAG